VGGVLVVHAPSGGDDAAAIAALAATARAVRAPLLVAALGEATGAAHRRTLAAAGVPAFASPEQAVRGFGHLVQDRRARAAARELPPSAVLALAPDRAAVAALFAAARAAGRDTLTQDEALAVLAAYGATGVPCRAATDEAAAVAAAETLGYPVVLKRRRSARPDPAARGGVALDLANAGELRAALAALERAAPASEGFVVQRQAGRARELLVRVDEDPVFGPAIGFGPGGTAAPFLHDLARDLPPLNLPLAHALIARTRVAATLGPLHDHPAADEEAVADLLVRVSQLVVDFPAIAALEINPAFASAEGVAVADAWIALRPVGAPPARLAIPPYPAELSGRFQARGEDFLVRPIRPEDADAHRAFFSRLSPEDVRYRFFSVMRELSPEQMARLTQIDYEREMAFVALRAASGDIVGVARLMHDFDVAEGEFAVVVQPDVKGCGLAAHLMGRIEQWGRAQGVRTMIGQVLADNAPMLGFMRHLGFDLHRLPDEDGLMEARREI
jgi:acetyltransferase